MKNIKKIIFIASMLLCGNSSAATISWSSPTTNISINDTFTIDIIGTDFLTNVDGGGINFTFDQNILNVVSVSIDQSVWDFGGFGINSGTIDNVNGTANEIMVNTFSNVTNNFVIASIDFTAMTDGISLLTLSEYDLNPWASGGSLINPDFVNTQISVSSVPLPAGIWLLGSGLIGLTGFIKRKKLNA